MDKKAQFDKEREDAKKFLADALGRSPTAAEILALMGARRRGQTNVNVVRNITKKASERKNLASRAAEAAKEAGKAARKAVMAEAKSKKAKIQEAEDEAAVILAEMNEDDRRDGKTVKRGKTAKSAPKLNLNAAAKALSKKTMKAMKNQTRVEVKAQREVAKKLKEALSAERKQLFKLAEEQAKKDIVSVIGKAPRMANVKRLAAIRTSGANISATNFLKVRNYRNARKTMKRVNQLASNLGNMVPDIDVCAACDAKRWLEKED
jgi:hypothetical protein